MKIKQGDKVVIVNSMSNWPMVADLFVKWGYPEEIVDAARENETIVIKVDNLDNVTSELSAWGIPWKRI